MIISLKIYLKERPDIVVCTGAPVTIPMCLIARMDRKKLIYIELFAKVTSPTQTGKLLYKCADQFYVQCLKINHQLQLIKQFEELDLICLCLTLINRVKR